MVDHIALLKDRLAKCETKVMRYRKTLETAENELSDVKTALRVLGEITGESDGGVKSSTSNSTASRQFEIATLLGVGRENAQSPIDLFETYKLIGSDAINLETFRTTIWRMKERIFEINEIDFIVRAADGTYWKERIDIFDRLAVARNGDGEAEDEADFSEF